MLCFGLTGTIWPAIGAYLAAALLRHAAAPMLNVWMVANTSSATRTTVFSLQSQVDALGQIACGPPAGWVGQRASMGAGIATSGAFLLPAVLCFALAARWTPRATRAVVPSPVAEPAA